MPHVVHAEQVRTGIYCQLLFWALLLQSLPTLFGAQKDAPIQDLPPYKRLLVGEDKAKVEELEKRISKLEREGRFQEAIEPAKEVAEIRGKAQGGDHWQTLDAARRVKDMIRIAALPEGDKAEIGGLGKLVGHATALEQNGRFKDAQAPREKVLEVHRRLLGEEHSCTAASYNNLATNLRCQGKYREAQPNCEKALALRRKVLGEEHLDTAASYDNLAANLNAQGKYRDAQPNCEKALALRRKFLGEENTDTATSYNDLAVSLNGQGKFGEAQPNCEKALELRRKLLGEEHPDTAASYKILSENLRAQGK